MRLIKNKYLKILFTFLCLSFINESVNAAKLCRYEIKNKDIEYNFLVVGFSEFSEDAVNPYRTENGEYKAEYVLWYQFVNETDTEVIESPKYALKKEDINSTNAQLWNIETGKIGYRNFISANDWIARGCNIKNVDILYDSTMSTFGFSLSATEAQKQFDNLKNVYNAKYTSKVPTAPELNEEFATLQGTVNCSGAEIPYGVPYIASRVIKILKILTPIILILLGMIDFLKATIASDEKQMKDASSRFIRRILAAVIVFFVIAIVQFAFRLVGEEGEGTLGCFNCFLNGECGAVKKISGNVSSTQNSSIQRGETTSHESSSGTTHGGSGQSR